jgi:hypothetical protein
MTNINEFLKLNESILDPQVNNLSPDLWDKEQKLKKSVATHIVKKIETWLKSYTNLKPKSMYLMGSMTGYQYTDTSDIDVNFVIDIKDEDKLKEMRKALPNNHTLPGTKHPVNYYLVTEVKDEWKKAGPIYDIFKDRWIHHPSKEKKVEESIIIGSYRVVIEIARFFLSGLDSIITEYNSDVAAYNAYNGFLLTANKKEDVRDLKELIKFKLGEIVSDIDGIKLGRHMLHSLRDEAFVEDKEFEISTQIVIKDNANASINNLVYKYIEKLGYFEKLQKILDEKDAWLAKLNKA